MRLYRLNILHKKKCENIFDKSLQKSKVGVSLHHQTNKNVKAMTSQNFTFKLIKEITYKGVNIMLFNSTEGWFVETSQGLVSSYLKTKKQALEQVKIIKTNIKSEIL